MAMQEETLFNLTDNCDREQSLNNIIDLQKSFVIKNPKRSGEIIHKFLEFHLSALGLQLKESTEWPNVRLPNISPPNLDLTSLKPRAEMEVKIASLNFLITLVKSVKKSRVFAFWYVFFPKCAFNPCKSGIFELVNHPDPQVREKVLDLLSETFQSSKTHLQLANAHCKSGSFTPVCLEFALGLGRLIRCTTKTLYSSLSDGQPSQVSHASRTLCSMFESVPFHRLENGILTEIMESLIPQPGLSNPVIKIAILQLFAVISSISPPHPEVQSKFPQLFEWFYSLAFPKTEGKQNDNNIRYVSIQNLNLLVSLDTEQFMGQVSNIQPEIEAGIRKDKDQSIVIHALRLVKTIGKCGHSHIESNPGHLESEKRLLHFWLNFLKPSLLDSIEARDCPVLKAALCNCIAEVGGKIFCALPTDRRMLAVTLMLRLCRDSDHRTVTSAVRGIGMMVSLPTLQNDMAFLTDSAEIILELLSQKQPHHTVVTSCTWALANLSDSIAKYHQNRASKEQDQLSSLDDVFPPFLVLELIRKSVTFSFATNSHMNIRSNSVRSLGSLIQCLGAMTKWVQLNDFQEVEDICSSAVDAIVMNVSSGKVMKVRWNACYAAGGILRTRNLFRSESFNDKLIEALIPVIEECPNYKVRINASLALMSVPTREAFDNHFSKAVVTIAKAMESTVTSFDEVEEVQHRTELIDQLCLTYAYLLSMATSEDVFLLESQLIGYVDLMAETMKSVLLRISPEKTTVFVEAKRHLTSEALVNNRKKDRGIELFPSSLVDALSL